MSNVHLIQYGVLGNIGRFSAVDGVCYPPRCSVIIRTERGLEIGRVLSPSDHSVANDTVAEPIRSPLHGTLLRKMTVEDELLLSRINKNRDEAYKACCKLLEESFVSATLIDVELLFDGRRLYFYFLGDIPSSLETELEQLAAKYDSAAKMGQFAKTLQEGCGPGCGTENALGGGCGASCVGCSVSHACSTTKSQ